MKTPLQTLRNVFGYPAFRGEQAKIIRQIMGDGNALVLMPTGGGKSLCYQIPAILRHGVGMVISPLIALMQDQVDALQSLGVRAAYLNSTLDSQAVLATEKQLLLGNFDLLYVSPERVLKESFANILDKLYSAGGIALFAIDEAHCISQWGHDFRMDYRRLSEIPKRYPDVPRIALTATADDKTRQEITSQLCLDDAPAFVSSFDRPNICYTVVKRGSSQRQLLQFMDGHKGEAGIVYCQTREEVEETAQWLNRQGIKALPYHAGLVAGIRKTNQDRFLREVGIVMVATNAFGMGIDKPDVRFVAHLGLPKSIEAYYQETGRAGRDGLSAEAWLCYGLKDVMVHHQRIEEKKCSLRRMGVERTKLDAMLGWCRIESCRRARLLAYFSEDAGACGNCDNCLEPPPRVSAKGLKKQRAFSPVQTHDANDPLFLALRTWRSTIAREQEVPAFSVLSDRTLYRLSVRRPRTRADLGMVPGVGPDNASRYGRALLRLLA